MFLTTTKFFVFLRCFLFLKDRFCKRLPDVPGARLPPGRLAVGVGARDTIPREFIEYFQKNRKFSKFPTISVFCEIVPLIVQRDQFGRRETLKTPGRIRVLGVFLLNFIYLLFFDIFRNKVFYSLSVSPSSESVVTRGRDLEI